MPLWTRAVRVEEVEALWSVTDEGSEIYRANHSGGEPVNVSEETAELVSFALEMAEKTDGALSPPFIRCCGPGALPRIRNRCLLRKNQRPAGGCGP